MRRPIPIRTSGSLIFMIKLFRRFWRVRLGSAENRNAKTLPKLLALRIGPLVIALKDGDHELSRAIDNLHERAIDGFHSEPSLLSKGRHELAEIIGPVGSQN